MRGKPLILKELDSGCIIPTSHKLNEDGYFRYTIRNSKGKGRGKHMMYHRYVWEQTNGKIPKGYEVDHICKNRACCNIEHLQLLSRTEHLQKDNHMRYKQRKLRAKDYWKKHKVTGSKLAEIFKVSFSSTCKWIREWKAEGVETIRKE